MKNAGRLSKRLLAICKTNQPATANITACNAKIEPKFA